MTEQHRKSIKQFIETASSYIASKGVPAEVEGDTVRCGVIVGENGYDVTLWCEPETSRFYCKCVIRNVFPEGKRAAVVDLVLLRQSSGPVGGSIGVSRNAGDLMWETYCEAPNAPIDAALIHEVISVGVGTFNEIVEQVREVVAGLSPWTCMEDGDDGMIWN